MFCYVDDVLSLNKSYLGELEIKDTTDTAMSASYIDLLLAIGSEDWLRTKLCNQIKTILSFTDSVNESG
jgi:hypothetical protein